MGRRVRLVDVRGVNRWVLLAGWLLMAGGLGWWVFRVALLRPEQRDVASTYGSFGLAALGLLIVLGGPIMKAFKRPSPVPLAELVEWSVQDRLPRVAALNPYKLRATPSAYGNANTYGNRDEYVARAQDEPLAAALLPGRLVVLVGPSKAGKTRTAFEVLRRHVVWGKALLADPRPEFLGRLAGHPALSGSDPLVIWLDEPRSALAGNQLSISD